MSILNSLVSNSTVVGIAVTLAFLPILSFTFTPSILAKYGARQLFPNKTMVAHEIGSNRTAHNDGINRIIHLITNPLIFLSMIAMLNNTETIIPLSNQYIDLNAAGIYFLFKAFYYLYLDGFRGAAVLVPVYAMYYYREGFQHLVTGDSNQLWPLMVVYVGSQCAQIFGGHYWREGCYKWNIYQLFIVQQYINFMGLYMLLGFFPVLDNQCAQMKIYYEEDGSRITLTKEVDPPIVVFLKSLHWFNQYLMPHYSAFDFEFLSFAPILQNVVSVPGLVQIVIHRAVMEYVNLIQAPQDDLRSSWCAVRGTPTRTSKFRPDDGYATDIDNPMTGVTGFAVGRNMKTVPKHQRNPYGGPDVQLIAQRLLAREGFAPAGDQLNIIAAAWIQAQVHGWIGHYDGKVARLDKGAGVCPLAKFSFFETKERNDGHYNSERSQWWDVSFLYGQTVSQVLECRSFKSGKLKVNTVHPNTLSSRENGTYDVGDNKNSWVGIDLLKELFLKEHNYICDQLASEYPDMQDDELFGYARNILAAINAKVHTIDWTVELLKTNQLEVGMKTNWYGIIKAVFGKKAPGSLLGKVGKKKANNKGVPFCLTEEFAAVYRLHPLCPPGVILESESADDSESLQNASFVKFEELLGTKGREIMTRSPEMPHAMMKTMYSYPCGALVGSNYPESLRAMSPTDADGIELEIKIDMAAMDLFRDRERGIPTFNEFRRQLHLKPYKTWDDLTGGDLKAARKLELIYGAAPAGIEKCDLLVGDLYEKKLKGFAISETSFIVFLLMATRRLEADPFLHELLDEEHYTEFGLKHIDETESLLDILSRHYPNIAAPFIERKQSAFKPLYNADKWKEAIDEGVVDRELVDQWRETKMKNNEYFASIDHEDVFFDFDPAEVNRKKDFRKSMAMSFYGAINGQGNTRESIFFKGGSPFAEEF